MNEYAEGLWDNARTTEHDDMYEYMDHDAFIECITEAMEAQRKACAEAMIDSLFICSGYEQMTRGEVEAIYEQQTAAILSAEVK